jgi:hypothetical protein
MMELSGSTESQFFGDTVDIETRRKKQQDLMIRMVERKVRERAQQLYEKRGQAEGQALSDWVQAETEVLESSMAAPLYRRRKGTVQEQDEAGDLSPELIHESEACQEPV